MILDETQRSERAFKGDYSMPQTETDAISETVSDPHASDQGANDIEETSLTGGESVDENYEFDNSMSIVNTPKSVNRPEKYTAE